MNSNQAQEMQDKIFRKMTADQKIALAASFWQLGKSLNGEKIDFRKIYGANGPARPVGADRKNFR